MGDTSQGLEPSSTPGGALWCVSPTRGGKRRTPGALTGRAETDTTPGEVDPVQGDPV